MFNVIIFNLLFLIIFDNPEIGTLLLIVILFVYTIPMSLVSLTLLILLNWDEEHSQKQMPVYVLIPTNQHYPIQP